MITVVCVCMNASECHIYQLWWWFRDSFVMYTGHGYGCVIQHMCGGAICDNLLKKMLHNNLRVYQISQHDATHMWGGGDSLGSFRNWRASFWQLIVCVQCTVRPFSRLTNKQVDWLDTSRINIRYLFMYLQCLRCIKLVLRKNNLYLIKFLCRRVLFCIFTLLNGCVVAKWFLHTRHQNPFLLVDLGQCPFLLVDLRLSLFTLAGFTQSLFLLAGLGQSSFPLAGFTPSLFLLAGFGQSFFLVAGNQNASITIGQRVTKKKFL